MNQQKFWQMCLNRISVMSFCSACIHNVWLLISFDNVKVQSEMRNEADRVTSSNVTTSLYEKLKIRAVRRN